MELLLLELLLLEAAVGSFSLVSEAVRTSGQDKVADDTQTQYGKKNEDMDRKVMGEIFKDDGAHGSHS